MNVWAYNLEIGDWATKPGEKTKFQVKSKGCDRVVLFTESGMGMRVSPATLLSKVKDDDIKGA